MGVNDLAVGAVERECARTTVVGGDGKAELPSSRPAPVKLCKKSV